MRLQLGKKGVGREAGGQTCQKDAGLGMRAQKCQAGRHGHRGTEVPAHGVNGNPDHGVTETVKKILSNKTKARSMSAGSFACA
jgi:hypothetical protein